MLVWYEQHETRDSAFRRERRIKEWKRLWKLELIERFNPTWNDLYETLEAEKILGPGFRRDEWRWGWPATLAFSGLSAYLHAPSHT